jgi:hypothetical protein
MMAGCLDPAQHAEQFRRRLAHLADWPIAESRFQGLDQEALLFDRGRRLTLGDDLALKPFIGGCTEGVGGRRAFGQLLGLDGSWILALAQHSPGGVPSVPGFAQTDIGIGA